MANSMGSFIRAHLRVLQNTATYLRQPQTQQIRLLYARSTLGIETFEEQKRRTENQFSNIRDKFVTKMNDYTNEGSKNMVFTEDLKNMIYLARNDEDVDLVVRMMKRFTKQNSQMRFGNFIFGPVVMRMLHIQNKPDVALNCFKDPDLQGFFDQLITCQILLDLLFNNGKYKEILDAFEVIKERQVNSLKYPRNVIVLVYAALYKLNTKESLDYALELWNDLNEMGHLPMRRAVTFCAGLAVKQGNPEAALEIVCTCRNQQYASVRNIKVAALCALGRVEDAIPILKSILNVDAPEANNRHTFLREIFDSVKNTVKKVDNVELNLEIQRLEQLFEENGHISTMTLDEQLCSEIQSPAYVTKRPYEKYQREDFSNRRNDNRFTVNRLRPGLAELQ